jgi:hypothetical protein
MVEEEFPTWQRQSPGGGGGGGAKLGGASSNKNSRDYDTIRKKNKNMNKKNNTKTVVKKMIIAAAIIITILKSPACGWHTCFIFGRIRVQISARRTALLRFSVVFASPSRKMPGYCLRLAMTACVTDRILK